MTMGVTLLRPLKDTIRGTEYGTVSPKALLGGTWADKDLNLPEHAMPGCGKLQLQTISIVPLAQHTVWHITAHVHVDTILS